MIHVIFRAEEVNVFILLDLQAALIAKDKLNKHTNYVSGEYCLLYSCSIFDIMCVTLINYFLKEQPLIVAAKLGSCLHID